MSRISHKSSRKDIHIRNVCACVTRSGIDSQTGSVVGGLYLHLSFDVDADAPLKSYSVWAHNREVLKAELLGQRGLSFGPRVLDISYLLPQLPDETISIELEVISANHGAPVREVLSLGW